MSEKIKNGLIYENGELMYYKDGFPYHAGVIEHEGNIYYIGSGGKAKKGEHVVHKSMANGLLKRGTYKFDDEYKLVEGFYLPPKKKRRMRRKQKKILRTAFACFTVVFLLGFALIAPKFINNSAPKDEDKGKSHDVSQNIVIPSQTDEVLLCSTAAKKYYEGKITISEAIKSGSPYRSYKFSYFIHNEKNWDLYLDENENMQNPKKYVLTFDKNYLELNNLKVNTVYYYKVQNENEEIKGSFKTASSIRFVKIDGLHNSRDIGNVLGYDGKTVKQGMIIRGSEIDGYAESENYLSESQAELFKETFGFVYDFDLRSPQIFSGDYSSHLGEGVRHDFYNVPVYGGIFHSENKNIMKNIFSSFADETKYPMYLHCTYGADRTGVVVFLLQGILGVDEETLMREYRTSAFYQKMYGTNDGINIVINGLNSYRGDTLNEKIYNYLTEEIGVTDEEIQKIRYILLEDKAQN